MRRATFCQAGVGWGGGVKIEKGGGELCVFLRQDGGDVREGNSREGILVQKKEERLDEKERRT